MIYNHSQNSFSGGRLGARALGRLNSDAYKQAYKDGLNMIIDPLGGITRRGGSRFVGTQKYQVSDSILQGFKYSADDQYMLEFSHQVIRFYKSKARVMEGAAIFEVATPYDSTRDLSLLRFSQNDNKLIIVHYYYPPYELAYTSALSWSMTQITFTSQPDYWIAGSYPSEAWFYDQRLFLGATKYQPNRFRASKVGSDNYYDMGLGTGLATDAFDFKIVTEGQPNKINWVIADNILAVGTAGAEHVISPVDDKAAMATDNITSKKYTGYGGADTPAISIDATAIFLQKNKRKLRRFSYVFENDRYEAPDISALCPDVFESGVEQLAYVSDPNSIIWGRRYDGKLSGLTYEPDVKVYGLHSHQIAGKDAKILSMSSIDYSGDSIYFDQYQVYKSTHSITDSYIPPAYRASELWMIVERTIGGSTKKCIEVMDVGLPDEQVIDAAFFVDAGISVSSSVGFTTVDGLDHLEGEEVMAFTDGFMQGPFTVANGSITLKVKSYNCNAGLDYLSYVELLPSQIPSQQGDLSFEKKQISKIYARIHRTLGIRAGTNPDKMVDKLFGPTSTLDKAIDPVSGIIEIGTRPKNDRDIPIRIESKGPQPLTILSVYTPMDVGV